MSPLLNLLNWSWMSILKSCWVFYLCHCVNTFGTVNIICFSLYCLNTWIKCFFSPFCSVPGCRTADDLYAIPSCLYQTAVWQSIRNSCSWINVFPGVVDVSVALPAAHRSQTGLHPQPAVHPGTHTDQVMMMNMMMMTYAHAVIWSIHQLTKRPNCIHTRQEGCLYNWVSFCLVIV